MENNRFFKYIWRFNALAIAILVLLLLFIFLTTLINDLSYAGHNTINVEQSVPAEKELRTELETSFYGMVEGHSFISVSLYKPSDGKNLAIKSYAYPNSQINFGVLHLETGELKWVFPDNKQLVVDKEEIKLNKEGSGNSVIATGHLLTVISKDTTGDNQLSSQDDKTVWAFDPDGSNGRIILKGIKSEPTIKYFADNKAVLIFKDEVGQQVANFNIKNMTIEKVALLDFEQ